ncbi:MAG: Asp-tRNA(Asn)/Glu-tRNA(Gln) amidotransferase subunit GatC [Elusimicrobiota bacterium]|nr:Asp-tRNA(Asn)/Glu-tRNA(Gln) amidotransferase subunit GatC [Elusimicrobiota bacterium]
MKITKKDVEYIAHLARLQLTEEEIEKFTDQLGAILEYMDKLNQLNTTDIPPTTHVMPSSNIWREDIPERYKDTDSILNNAPEKESNYFKVKKIIE